MWLIRLHHPTISTRIQTIAAALGDVIAPTSLPDLHVTVSVAGFPTTSPERDDDISWSALEHQRKTLRFLPFELEVGRAGSFSTAAFLEVRDPSGGLAHVRRQLLSTSGEVRFAAYQPHVTIGVYRGDAPAAPICGVLGEHRSLVGVRVVVSSVELVTFEAASAGSPLETVWSV
ncbi:MAG: 2'-5' RNA ligase [Myxococcota bacterium]